MTANIEKFVRDSVPEDFLAIAEYKKGHLIPELVTQTFQTIWQKRGEFVGIKFEVTPCPFTEEELASLEKRGLRLGYLPPALATQESRHVLGKMFRGMQSLSVQKNNRVTNDQDPSGWFDYETGIDAPYLGTTEEQLLDRLLREERTLLSLNQYIIAGQDSRLFVGQYMDQGNTWARVASRYKGHLVRSSFGSGDRMSVDWCFVPRYFSPNLGGRSSGVNRA